MGMGKTKKPPMPLSGFYEGIIELEPQQLPRLLCKRRCEFSIQLLESRINPSFTHGRISVLGLNSGYGCGAGEVYG